MYKEIHRSERYFTIFDFLISHGQFLIRASKNDEYKTNIDIVFFGAKFIQSIISLYGVVIRPVNKEDVTFNYKSVNRFLTYEHQTLFEIESGEEKYYIVASFVKVFENDLGFKESSLGYEGKGREVMIAEWPLKS